MAENVYTRVLKQLVAIEGSTQAVASLLRVPEGTLLWWMNGRAQMPLRALLKAMDLVAKHELEEPGEKLTFAVGPVRARCVRCGGTEFRPAKPGGALTYTSLLACCGCAREIVHGDLVVQVAKDAGVQAKKPRKARQHS